MIRIAAFALAFVAAFVAAALGYISIFTHDGDLADAAGLTVAVAFFSAVVGILIWDES